MTAPWKLRSADPLDTPEINFHYFNELTRARAKCSRTPTFAHWSKG